MKVPFNRKKLVKFIANVCFFSLVYQLVFPLTTYALTSGPSQPEMQSFEPVGTTDMVNMFSGDFNYNIPLLDVEGYPVNIYYHSGVTMEQEASWVGLGWNINPGNINHIVRGFSDDYNGDVIEKKLKVEDETNKYFNVFFGVEAAGVPLDKIFGAAASALKNSKITGGGQLNFGMNFNNYTGVSASVGVSGGVKTRNASKEKVPWISGGMNMGATVSTDKGVDVDYSITARSLLSKVVDADVTGSAGGSMNSREGMKYNYWGVNPAYCGDVGVVGALDNTYIPTGLQNYVPVVTNATKMSSLFFQLKVGGEAWSIYPSGGGGYGENTMKVEEDGSKKAYGYFNLGNASTNDIMDFARERDGNINRSTKSLPLPTMTYDIYSVSGQGTGGSFRPYRNDMGTVHDPELGSHSSSDSHLGEAGLGNTFEGGYDYKTASTTAHSGPWKIHNVKYTNKQKGSFYEPYFLKQAGELTPRNSTYYNNIKQKDLLNYTSANSIDNITAQNTRVPRANLLYFLTAEEASRRQISLLPKLESYNSDFGFKNTTDWSAVTSHDRINSTAQRKAHQISEFTQLQQDGKRYVYGLPVMNTFQKDYEVDVAAATSQNEFDNDHYETNISFTGDMPGGSNPRFSSRTNMPSYAHSYLLTCVLSPDYVDITGNGITEDDLGSYTKFNYKKRENYQWRVPYSAGTGQRSRGFKSDCKDDHATFSGGEREQWTLHSIESRNFVAEFYTSARKDGEGAQAEIAIFPSGTSSKSYKLDSIALYNKWDRFENEEDAEPIQTVVFSYDYSLCTNLPNNHLTQGIDGKLTLKSIHIKKGTSHIGYLSPYQFVYAKDATVNQKYANPSYNVAAKDCWGNYKEIEGNKKPSGQNINLNNLDYPYVNQNDTEIDSFSRAWNLEEITLPSGGKIKVTYEADDYAYVQDKKAMEMFKVEGVGPGTKFVPNNTLYQSATNPYLYVYFKRKTSKEHGGNIATSYLDGNDIIQFNFDVQISSGTAASCPNTSLTESVKGYARVVESGICDNSDYGYLKLEPRNANTAPQLSSLGITGAKLNPITLAAINLARFRAPKILNPEMDIPTGSGKALISAFKAALGDFASFFQNQLKTNLNKGKAQNFTIGKSYVRLVSQGLKKKGGGHRVKRLEFIDNWAATSPFKATYGSVYDYTIPLPGTSMKMSSGVATYEPLLGGDENACRTLMTVNEIGNSSKFPAADPIELQQEHPIGETMYPPASVGYSKITVTSIHKDAGESSQTIQEFEHYTAKDFPIRTIMATPLEVLEDKKPKAWELFNKQEVYRLAQGYVLELNDMHGKLKQTSTWVAKYNPQSLQDNPDSRELVSYTKYNYFRNADNSLKNDGIPCIEFNGNGKAVKKDMTLGEDVELTIDTREKDEKSTFTDFHFSTNGFLAPPIPIVIPIGFPKNKKQSKVFSTFVNSKIVQKYGIVQSVETYNKGALTKAENVAFDPTTGDALITSVNTEYDDREYTIRYPAYWAYRNMGAAYENILFEEDLKDFDIKGNVGSVIRDGVAYLDVKDASKYNIGDEIEITIDDLCANTGPEGKKYKLWVVDKTPIKPNGWSCSSALSPCQATAQQPLMYRGTTSATAGQCLTETELKDKIYEVIKDVEIYNLSEPIINVDINHYYYSQNNFNGAKYMYQYYDPVYNCTSTVYPPYPGAASLFPSTYPSYTYDPKNFQQLHYEAVLHPNYSNVYPNRPIPGYANFETTIGFSPLHYIAEQKSGSSQQFVEFWHTAYSGIQINVSSTVDPRSTSMGCDFYDRDLSGKPTFKKFIQIATATNPPSCSSAIEVRAGIKLNQTHLTTKQSWPGKRYLVAKPLKKQAPDIVSASNPVAFPDNDDIVKGSVKVVRSGKRNQLQETVQEATIIANPSTQAEGPFASGQLISGYGQTIQSSAKIFTDTAYVPDNISTDYFNPYVTGERGNYRVKTTLVPLPKRDYPDGGGNNQSDRYKGKYSTNFFWQFNAPSNSEYYNKMFRNSFHATYWKPGVTYKYSIWGSPVSVVDALGHSNIALYDFGNRVPGATLSNIGENEAIYESFEDIYDLYKQDENPIRSTTNPFVYYPNPIKQFLRNEINPNVTSSSYVEVLTGSHSGKRAIKFKQNTDIYLDLFPVMFPYNYLQRFYMHAGRKYVVSCWQKTGTNGSAPPVHSGVEIKWGTSIMHKALLTAKTPSIDGWVLYEAIVTVPTSASTVTISAAGNTIIDDFRIFPADGNMKAFVYDDVHRRISATLDENHMTTFFEYDSQGKLVRVKKETAKGILTIKESRESLKELITN